MTERIYYTDPAVCEFDAVVVAVEERDGRNLVRLDRSAFYPTSGGQPFDVGTLGGWPVVDVFDEDDDILHVVGEAGRKGPALQVGEEVHGSIDSARRLDHMQQHSGQHVLSAAFDRLFNVPTVSFHLGAETSTIDLARELLPAQITAAEAEANRIVWGDQPVTIRFVTAEEATSLPLRKTPAKTGTLRLIEVGDFDLSACGGTHVARTGQIGAIGITSWERFKGGQRIEFVCGGRLVTRHQMLRDAVQAAVHVLSVAPGELAKSIERLQEELKAQRKEILSSRGELMKYRAAELVAASPKTARGRVVALSLEADATALKTLAAALAAHSRTIAVVVSASTPALVVISRAADSDVDASALLSQLVAKFGGRGGGKADLAQAGGLNSSADVILTEALALIEAS